MHILCPLDMALLGEVRSAQTLHSRPRGLVLSTPQLAAAYMPIQKINVSKERELCASQCKQLLGPHSSEKLFRSNKRCF